MTDQEHGKTPVPRPQAWVTVARVGGWNIVVERGKHGLLWYADDAASDEPGLWQFASQREAVIWARGNPLPAAEGKNDG